MKNLFYVLFALALFSACEEEEILDPTNVISGTISSATTWTADKVWIIDDGVSVEADLIIEPGTTLKFNEGAYLSIGGGTYGSLTAIGTADKPIIFTSNASVPSSGDWRGLEFWEKNAKSSALAFCTFEYAGDYDGYRAAIYMYDTELSMVNCTIRKSETMGINNQYGGFKLFNLNNISDCGDYPVAAPAWAIHAITSDNIISGKGVYVNHKSFTNLDETWHLLTVPYVLDWIEINENATLTIEPGCTLKFDANGGITVGNGSYGKLIAQGTALLPITFTTSAQTPSTGDWRGLELWEKTSNGTIFDYCKVLYGGSSDGYGANIYAYDNGENITIKNSEIGYSEGCGIATPYSTPLITNIVYVNNANNLCTD